ncbi:MAG: anaerobic sulfatase maturase [Anaerolineae bacterium]
MEEYLSPEGRPAAFQVMAKPRGPVCNLRCRYCYYLSTADYYPTRAFRMSDALLEEFTRQYIAAQQLPEVVFVWQGGEPTLMGLEFFRRAVELQEKYRRPGMRVINALQTNGVILDDEWARFFKEHDFLIGLSLDGPQELHDAYRRDAAGRPTFDRVMAGLRVLQRHGVAFNILATVHQANVSRPLEVYRFFRDAVGAQFIQFIPIVEREGGRPDGEPAVSPRSVTAPQYGQFLISIFDEWVRRDVGRVFVQIFDVALAAWAGRRPGLCIFEETCGTAMVLEHNGDVYACDHFVYPAYRLGNIGESPLWELAGSERQRRFGLDKRDALPRYCRECRVYFVCHGECPKNRFLLSPAGEPGLNYLCQGYQMFFAHIDRPMRMMVEELRAGRAPAGVMLRLAQEELALRRRFAQARPNDPCPCGSGKKFKRCHGRRG